MAQAGLDDLHGLPVANEQAGVVVPQVVEAGLAPDLRPPDGCPPQFPEPVTGDRRTVVHREQQRLPVTHSETHGGHVLGENRGDEIGCHVVVEREWEVVAEFNARNIGRRPRPERAVRARR